MFSQRRIWDNKVRRNWQRFSVVEVEMMFNLEDYGGLVFVGYYEGLLGIIRTGIQIGNYCN